MSKITNDGCIDMATVSVKGLRSNAVKHFLCCIHPA